MMNKSKSAGRVDVVERNCVSRNGWLRCEIEENIKFNVSQLESYCIAEWEPIVYDAMLVAAAVEFADRSQRRPAYTWEREISLRIPVHEVDLWRSKEVGDELRNTLNFLTGDRWHFEFEARSVALMAPQQGRFKLPESISAVIPFSDGLDSRAVAGLLDSEMGDRLVRVRLGSKTSDRSQLSRYCQPFTSVPYRVQPGEKDFVESSSRSRGFKFALVCGLASYLAKANEVIVSESGQGALGPALVTVGQGYEDYRSHPLFTRRMERFLAVLLGHQVQFTFPRLWFTKAETLAKYLDECATHSAWEGTWSCWQQTRQVSVDKKKRQCGVCAACMLRRMSVHAAGLAEPRAMYVWEDLATPKFEDGAAVSFPKDKITKKLRQYAVAGSLHLDHLAGLRQSQVNARAVELNTFQLSRALNLPELETQQKLNRLLTQHESEWKGFVKSLGSNSFLADWATHANL